MACDYTAKHNSGTIRRHIETHLDGLSYPCNMCNKEFRSNDSLYHHNRKLHKFSNQSSIIFSAPKRTMPITSFGNIQRNQSSRCLEKSMFINDSSTVFVLFGQPVISYLDFRVLNPTEKVYCERGPTKPLVLSTLNQVHPKVPPKPPLLRGEQSKP